MSTLNLYGMKSFTVHPMKNHTLGMSHSDYSAELLNLCAEVDAHQACKLILAFDTCDQLATYQALAKDNPHARQLLSRAHGITVDSDTEPPVSATKNPPQ